MPARHDTFRVRPASLAVALLLAGAADTHAEPPDAAAWQRLRQGEVLVESINTTGSGGSVRVSALMYVDVQTLWTYIASCTAVFEYVDGMRECELLEVRTEPGADVSTVRQVVDKGWLVPRLEFTMEVRREPWVSVEFHLLEGDLEAMQGWWRFEPQPEGALLVTHQILLQPRLPAPRWLIRRTMHNDLPDMLACLRGLTGGSAELQQEADLARCPHNERG